MNLLDLSVATAQAAMPHDVAPQNECTLTART